MSDDKKPIHRAGPGANLLCGEDRARKWVQWTRKDSWTTCPECKAAIAKRDGKAE